HVLLCVCCLFWCCCCSCWPCLCCWSCSSWRRCWSCWFWFCWLAISALSLRGRGGVPRSATSVGIGALASRPAGSESCFTKMESSRRIALENRDLPTLARECALLPCVIR